MSVLGAEARKLLGLRAVRWTALVGAALPVALTALNASTVRRALDAGRGGDITAADLGAIGTGEMLVTIAATAAIGALAVGQEYRRVSLNQGGGRQATTSALAVPRAVPALLAKLVATALLIVGVAAVAAASSLLLAHALMGTHALPLDGARWDAGARGVVYATLTGLLALALSALLRNGLAPLVYLVANSTIISPGYLLAQVWPVAWYLPDTSGMALLQTNPDPHRPSALVGGLVMTGWVAALLVAAIVAEGRRER